MFCLHVIITCYLILRYCWFNVTKSPLLTLFSTFRFLKTFQSVVKKIFWYTLCLRKCEVRVLITYLVYKRETLSCWNLIFTNESFVPHAYNNLESGVTNFNDYTYFGIQLHCWSWLLFSLAFSNWPSAVGTSHIGHWSHPKLSDTKGTLPCFVCYHSLLVRFICRALIGLSSHQRIQCGAVYVALFGRLYRRTLLAASYLMLWRLRISTAEYWYLYVLLELHISNFS